MNWRQLFTVYRKELTDALRDRRTLISMFVVPTLIIPAIMLGFGAMSYKAERKVQEEVPTVMIVGGADSPELREELARNKRVRVVPFAENYKRQIEDKKLRAALEIPDGFESAIKSGAAMPIVTICSYMNERRSSFAAGELEKFLGAYREKVLQGKLESQNLKADFHRVFMFKRQNVAPPEKVGGAVIGGMIPYMLILLSFTGAMYSAMDLTAGEKERGTMETILCSPVGRTELVLGKFLLVLTSSLVTVLCTLVSTAITTFVGVWLLAGSGIMKGASAGGGMVFSLSVPGLLAVCLLVVPLAVLFAAVLFSVSLCAKSYKEAQSYVTPLLAVVFLPAMVAMLPGVELNVKLAMVPLVNVALVSKEMVSGNFPVGMISLIFGSTCVYAAVALRVAVSMFKREGVIFRV